MKRTLCLVLGLLIGSPAPAADVYYLSASGYLVGLDLDNISETAQIEIGTAPWDMTACGEHIYISDFARDLFLRFTPKSNDLSKLKIPEAASENVYDLAGSTRADSEKSFPVKAYEWLLFPSSPPSPTPEVKQQLPAAKHNRRNGLRDMACGGKYVYVASYLRNRIEVIDREAWQRVASLKLPHRPQALAASPDGSRLAILQSGNRELMLVEPEAASGFSKTRHIDAVASASDLEWLDESRIALLARGKDSISLVNLAADEEEGLVLPVKLPTDINGMVYHPSTEKLYVLSGNSKRVYEIDPASGSYETISLEEDLDYPSFLATLDANRLAVGSETDGRIAVLDLPSGDISSRIQSNLPPKLMLQLTDTTGRKSVSGELKEKK